MDSLSLAKSVADGNAETVEYMNGTIYTGEPMDEIDDRKLIIEAGAADPLFFCHYFFPRAYRQPDPPFARKVWWELLNPEHRFVNMTMSRGFGKTTQLRTFSIYRIAYGMSKVILYIGKNDDHAKRSVEWIRRAVRFNDRWRKVFGVVKGDRFNQNILEMKHGLEGYDIFTTAVGITGSIRGINFDSYRPDLIVLDDIVDKEMVSTPAATKKITDLVYSDVLYSLEEETDNPHAKLANLCTPLSKSDPGSQMATDPDFHTIKIPCWTPETIGLDIDRQVSAWDARIPTDKLRKQKRNALKKNKLYLFLQEKELRLTSPDTQAFKDEWLQQWDILPPRHEMQVVMIIDPVPPPSEKQIREGMAKKDYEALTVVGAHVTGYYQLETMSNRGHDPDWTIWAFFTLCKKWRPRVIRAEGVGYQRTLQWILRRAMQERREYHVVEMFDDKRAKHDVIVDGLNGPASNGKLWLHPQSTMMEEQFLNYPDVENDDEIETLARGVTYLHEGALDDADEEEGRIEEEEDEFRKVGSLGNWRLV